VFFFFFILLSLINFLIFNLQNSRKNPAYQYLAFIDVFEIQKFLKVKLPKYRYKKSKYKIVIKRILGEIG